MLHRLVDRLNGFPFVPAELCAGFVFQVHFHTLQPLVSIFQVSDISVDIEPVRNRLRSWFGRYFARLSERNRRDG